jgi:hypothetical protein
MDIGQPWAAVQPQSIVPQFHKAVDGKTQASPKRRRQYRSCDNCRKYRRACDALARGIDPFQEQHLTFAAPHKICSTCEKTRKNCTFKWLQSLPDEALPKRVKDKRNQPPVVRENWKGLDRVENAVTRENDKWGSWTRSQIETSVPYLPMDTAPQLTPAHVAAPSALFPRNDWCMNFQDAHCHRGGAENFLITAFEPPNSSSSLYDFGMASHSGPVPMQIDYGYDANGNTEPMCWMSITDNNTIDDSIDFHTGPAEYPPLTQEEGSSKDNDESHLLTQLTFAAIGTGTSSTTTASTNFLGGSALETVNPFEGQLARSITQSMITHGLVQIYQDSFENAVLCWLGESDSPFKHISSRFLSSDYSSKQSNTPSAVSLFGRTCQLDFALKPLREVQLTAADDALCSKALKLAILSFASQWSPRQRSRRVNDSAMSRNFWGTPDDPLDFDHLLRSSLWHDARRHIRHSADLGSFRVILAQFLFSLIECPMDDTDFQESWRLIKSREAISSRGQSSRVKTLHNGCRARPLIGPWGQKGPAYFWRRPTDLQEIRRCYENAELQLLQWSSKIERIMSTTLTALESPSANSPSAEVRRTILQERSNFNMLFWFGIMGDSALSAITMKPLIISDEDSSYQHAEMHSVTGGVDLWCNRLSVGPQNQKLRKDNVWGEHLLGRLYKNELIGDTEENIGLSQAEAILQETAPVKVMFWRKIEALQTVFSKATPTSASLEKLIKDALSVYQHWNNRYGSFFKTCIAHHTNLTFKLQSWYITVAMHWHVAALILSQCIDGIDAESKSETLQRSLRLASGLVLEMKKSNSYAMTELARASCSSRLDHVNDLSVSRASFHEVFGQAAILTDPWTDATIEGLTTACETLMLWLTYWQAPELSPELERNWVICNTNSQDLRSNSQDIIKALVLLGQKSDCATLTAAALDLYLKDL